LICPPCRDKPRTDCSTDSHRLAEMNSYFLQREAKKLGEVLHSWGQKSDLQQKRDLVVVAAEQWHLDAWPLPETAKGVNTDEQYDSQQHRTGIVLKNCDSL